MKQSLRMLGILASLVLPISSFSQCASGYSQASLNWDYLDYFPSAGNGTYTGLSHSQTQKFAFGTQKLTITHNYTGSNAAGETDGSTAETGSYGSGEEVQYVGDGIVTYTFQSAVQNIKFSIYDIDYNQKVTVTALDGATTRNITMAKVSGTVLTIAGSGTASASATAGATSAVALSSTDGTINVDITGPVTSFTITVTQTNVKTSGPASGKEDGSFYVSDLTACSPGSFPSNYFNVSKPFTNQPGYVLTVRNDSIYYVNPADGKARYLFYDPGHSNINSVAYDPVNHFVYYVFSLTGSNGTTNETNKVLRRYDYNMDTLGVVMNDVTALLPTFNVGVESGAAAFYDGALYLGIEASSSSSYESIIWKIEFNSSFAPVSASQVYGITGSGHDWADIGITNGILYDFDGSATAPDFYHVNLMTRAVTNYSPLGGLIPRQTAIDWNDQVYNVGQPSSGTTGTIAPYLYNGGINTSVQKTISYNGANVTGSWGDAAEAFKPKADFGDAPASYDPDPDAPALHEVNPNLRLGATVDIEWSKNTSANASLDGSDEDGLPFVKILSNSGNYYTDLNVFNNTGANATVCAWIDLNMNGIFEPGEGTTNTVPSSASMQTIQLFWPSVVTSLTNNSYTFLRIRISSEANGMTTANSTGYFYDGEVEDYYLVVNDVVLDMKLQEFTATKINESGVQLLWNVLGEEAGTTYELQRSIDGQNWFAINRQVATLHDADVRYTYVDNDPEKPVSMYRLMYTDIRGRTRFSTIKKIQFMMLESFSLYPNPTSDLAHIRLESAAQSLAQIRVIDISGKLVFHEQIMVKKGLNNFELPVQQLSSGYYTLQLEVQDQLFNKKLIIR